MTKPGEDGGSIVDALRRAAIAGSAACLAACATSPATVAGPATKASNVTMEQANSARYLTDHQWRLESATDGNGQPIPALSARAGAPVELTFGDGRIQIRGGCNLRGANVQVSAAGTLTVERMMTTMMACEPPLMQVDAALSSLFATPLRYEVAQGASPRLRLVSAANDKLEFSGRMTPEARYGAPAIVFLEVAPRRVACNHPLIAGASCLQVRDISFDPQGLRTGTPGEWRLLYGTIEGFDHTEGVRNVVRVKRFTRTPVPADASATLYVLDLVVESEIVPP